MIPYRFQDTPILLIDDEQDILFSYSVILQSAGMKNVITMDDGSKALEILEKEEIKIIVLDLLMPHASGADLLSQIKSNYPDIQIIIMTAVNDVDKAVDCMRNNAFDYLVKPVREERFLSCVEKVLENVSLRNEVSRLKERLLKKTLENEEVFREILTENEKMRGIFHYIETLSVSREPVLIRGETGSGKELIANAVHTASKCMGKFVAVNVSGLDDTVFSDTLFGHEKGAYTGAEKKREGLIALAARGTLFLDEIGDLDEHSQVKLLRLLQEQTYFPLGTDTEMISNARIVVATNQPLEELMKKGTFRKDLYYRLRTHQIEIPPLRERPEDIALLLNSFLEEAAETFKKKKPTIPTELPVYLCNYHFPGNVRELKALAFDAVARHSSGILSMKTFRDAIGNDFHAPASETVNREPDGESIFDVFRGRRPTLKEVEDFMVEDALRVAAGNQGIAASLLGMNRNALNKRLLRRKNNE